MLNTFAFIVLNFQCTAETIKCIESIEQLNYPNKFIVVVDNASNDQNEFFSSVKGYFKNETNITYLQSDTNTGYARGNNMGIDYAKRVLHADYVCVINPDTVIIQSDFIQKCIELYDNYSYTVLGPAIISGSHNSNPLGKYHESVLKAFYYTLLDIKVYYVKKWNLKRFNPFKSSSAKSSNGDIPSCPSAQDEHCHEQLNSSGALTHDKNNNSVLIRTESPDSYKEAGNIIETYTLNSKMNVALCGACLIFSPMFFKDFSGFCSGTFLYCEEYALACVCYNTGHTLLYSSEISINHEGGKSSDNMDKDEDAKIMRIAKVCALSWWTLTKIYLHKHSNRYLKKTLNPKIDKYHSI